MAKFYFTHGRGLSHFAETEIKQLINKLREKDNSFYLTTCDYIEGKLSFETNVALEQLLKLTTIERLFYQIIFKKFDKIPLQDEVLQLIDQFFTINSVGETFINTIVTPECDEQLENIKKIRKSITFRIDSKLTGKWKVSLIIGIPVSKLTISNRESIKNIGLRSTICSALIQLSEIKNQSNTTLVFDPFCGKSTILCELILQCRNSKIFYISSDADRTQLDFSTENFKSLSSKNVQSDFLLLNLSKQSHFPFRTGIFDSIITDLPFGNKHPIQFFENPSSRLLTKGSCEAKQFEELINQIDTDLKLVSKYPVSLGETNAVILKLSKSESNNKKN
ncbi:THUMP domain-containing 2 [Brachionus plicatilis]|uniref:THUMP domain-containing 2 n=1 Tax=Brachionus plicatilis TaxID=10195 RepID=A0A3M7PC83_BRAPC|nr:THUMP domain-containing 2 [Brachionus plicatilis]